MPSKPHPSLTLTTPTYISIINELLRYAKEAGKDILKDEDDDGNTALHLACINERFYAAKVLILAGADPEDRYGNMGTRV